MSLQQTVTSDVFSLVCLLCHLNHPRWLDTAFSYTQVAHSPLPVLDRWGNVRLSEPSVCLGR